MNETYITPLSLQSGKQGVWYCLKIRENADEYQENVRTAGVFVTTNDLQGCGEYETNVHVLFSFAESKIEE